MDLKKHIIEHEALDIISNFLGVFAEHPYAVNGSTYINSSNNGLYLYYGGNWNLIYTLAAPLGIGNMVIGSSFIIA